MPARTFSVDHRLIEISKGDFHTALGSFLDEFSTIEMFLIFVVQHYSKVDWAMTKALLSPLRVDNGISLLNRILEARRARSKKAKELKLILDHLGAINKTRNDILHHGFQLDPKGREGIFFVSNDKLARSPKVHFRMQISKRQLDHLRYDLLDINYRLAIRHVGSSATKWSKNAREFQRLNPLGVHPAWRYKPPARASKRRNHRGTSQSQQRQQTPSAP
jgi:hypothetical protein